MSTMHENLKHKNPIETKADQQEQEYGLVCLELCAYLELCCVPVHLNSYLISNFLFSTPLVD